MAESKTKIAQQLSPEELRDFCEKLRGVPHEEMAERIQALAAEAGISIGRSAAYEFRNKEALPYIRRLQLRREKAEQLRAATEGQAEDSSRTLADFTAGELSQISFDFVSELDGNLDLNSKEGLKTFDIMTKAVKRLRDGDRAMLLQLTKLVNDTKEDLQNTELSEEQRARRMRERFGV